MKMIFNMRGISVASLTAAAFFIPNLAHATETYSQYYEPSTSCQSKESDAQLIGGIVGAVVGGVVGSQVSGNGARTEGSALGAVVGGLAGAGLGDQSVDCNKRYDRSGYINQPTYGNTTVYTPPATPYSRPSTSYARPTVAGPVYTKPVYSKPSVYSTGYDSGYFNTSYRYRPTYGHVNNSGVRYDRAYEHRLENVSARLRDVRQQLRRLNVMAENLRRRIRHTQRPNAYRRLDIVCADIERLERKERILQRRKRSLLEYRY